MKKSIVIIFAVAIIGGLGVYAKSSNSPKSTQTSQQAANTSSGSNPTVMADNTSTSSDSSSTSSSGQYKDGTYTGRTESNEYGDVQVQAVVSSGQITNIGFLKMPSDAQKEWKAACHK